MRAHPADVEQLLQTGPQQMPVMVVQLGTVRAVHRDTAQPARRQQGLIDGQITKVSEQPGALLVVQRLVVGILGVIQGL